MAEVEANSAASCGCATRKDKRKALKKEKRKQLRKEAAIKEREEEAARFDDPEENLRAQEREQEEAEIAERDRQLFEERERLWLQAAAARKAVEEEEERRRKLMDAAQNEKIHQDAQADEFDEDDEWDYIEEGPAEIIWKGNEIIVKKKKIRVAKGSLSKKQSEEDDNRPTSNPLPPQSVAFASYMDSSSGSAQEALDRVAQEVPNFGTEQDKAHCPFHLKTGACRFGSRCSRVHFHPDKSCTLLVKNMYNGPGLAWEQDEGLEYTDEEVEQSYEEFYEDVHTEFLKFGELVNFKVCNNGSYHLRGNVYVHYKSLDSAVLAYNSINGRYFAGKQIICEFVSVTRWKVAICGEYMKSRLKTCSHGSACNFIHCFRNPGGDYEWADWDNPPPKYWIRKMVALFGPSNEYENDIPVDCRVSERRRSSSRMQTLINKSYHSHRSDSGGSPAIDSDKTRDQQGRCSNRREHSSRSSRSKEDPTFEEKYERSKEYDKSGQKRYRMNSYDFSEDNYNENDRVKQQKHEARDFEVQEKYKLIDKEDFLRQKRGRSYSIEHMKSKRHKSKFHEKQEYGQSSDYADDGRELADVHYDQLANEISSHRLDIYEERYNRSHSQSSRRLSIDEERYSGRSDDLYRHISIDEERYTGRSPEDLGYGAGSSWAQHDAELPHRSSNASHVYKSDGRRSQSRKENDDNFSSAGSDPENVHEHSPLSRSRQKRKHDSSIK